MPALEDLIRGELMDAADHGQPDMTPREVEALTVRLARKLRPRLIGETGEDPARKGQRTERPSERELQTLGLLAEGANTATAAAAMHVTRSTIHDHLRRLGSRWGVRADPEVLVNAGFERGWLAVPEVRPVVEVDLGDLTALGLLASGRRGEVGVTLGWSEHRVVEQRARLMREFGASSDAGLVAAAWRAGVLPLAPIPQVTGASTP